MLIAFQHEIKLKRKDFNEFFEGKRDILEIKRLKNDSGMYRGDFIRFTSGFARPKQMLVEILGVTLVKKEDGYYYKVHVSKVI